MALDIKKAQATHLPAVHDLVRELAVYEHAEREFTATLTDYQRDFAAGVFEVLVATESENVIGMALYYLTYSTWKGRMLYLEDFVVRESYRRSGVGQLLFDAFLAEARRKKCRMVKWQVLDWNEPAIRFYEKQGATIETNWHNGKLIFSETTLD